LNDRFALRRGQRSVTIRTYDGESNLTQTVNAAGDPTRFAYDVANQLTIITDALIGIQAFTYAVEGNVETFTDARSNVQVRFLLLVVLFRLSSLLAARFTLSLVSGLSAVEMYQAFECRVYVMLMGAPLLPSMMRVGKTSSGFVLIIIIEPTICFLLIVRGYVRYCNVMAGKKPYISIRNVPIVW
jgi:YD repeat-containing protein